jgi:NAD(P)-dependent dehydrogenase (short-subunit alcohol dehydrogenase family)
MANDTQATLAGRVAIVTGAASGMGRVMARSLAQAGARIAAVDINAAGLETLAAEPAFSGTLVKSLADVSRAQDCRRAVDLAQGAFGKLDILINCAGVSVAQAAPDKRAARVKFQDTDPEGWQRVLAINCVGAFLMARFAVEPMLANGWGRIINVTTSFDTMLADGLCAYGASKAALEASTASWAKDLAGTGVTVNVLVPGGPVDTVGFFPPGQPRPPRMLQPDVMAAPVAWLASPQSDGVTGRRFIARDWDTALPPVQAAEKCGAPAAWTELAAAAQKARGVAI